MKADNLSMRDAYGDELVKLGDVYPELTVLDSDVSSSTRTVLFAEKYPERFFNVGVAEANMVDIAGGLALGGLKPIVNSFAIFLALKATEQIRNVICYNNLPVILAGSYAGLSDSYDGASHQSIEDIAIMRVIPNLNVIVPADAIELRQALRQALTLNTPTYLRICRNPSPVLFEDSEPYKFSKIRIIKEGKDITIAACGITVSMAMQAIEELEKQNISAELLNVSTIKPLDGGTILTSVKKTNCLLTVEEHSVSGGLGGAIAEFIANRLPLLTDFAGINDTFTETGGYEELLDKYQISTKAIVKKALKLIQSKVL
ncbi:MAG: transketolase family protein [Prevotella sp.]|jgi:transketolase|nr:transketolase family protein [Prevotella sp.]